LLAAFSAHKSGHALNNRLARALLSDRDAWEIVTFPETLRAPEKLRCWLAQTQTGDEASSGLPSVSTNDGWATVS
jgi:hypothetical protein